MKNTTLATSAAIAFALCVASATGCGSSTSTTTSSSSSHASTSTTSSSHSSTSGSTSSSGGGSTSSSSTSVSGSTSTSSSSGSSGFPAPPTIGMQLDRIGRPAVNTALNHAFDSTAAAGTAKDAYNADSNEATWTTTYTPQFAANMAVIDALDGKCGNQFGYTSPASATSYAKVAGALADDRIYLNTAGTTSALYLGVELNALGATTVNDQGGRTLTYQVMDVTYSALAAGSLASPPPVTNGIKANDVAFTTTFPYEAAPH